MNFFRGFMCAFCRESAHPGEASNIIIYVKHYLNFAGLKYFEECWFPLVHAIMSQQKGFLLLEHEGTMEDCVYITLKFENEQTFHKWVEYTGHEDLVNALDPFRSRNYWEVQKEGESWQIIKSKRTAQKNVYKSTHLRGRSITSRQMNSSSDDSRTGISPVFSNEYSLMNRCNRVHGSAFAVRKCAASAA